MAFIQTKDLKFTYDDVEDGEAGKVHEVLKGVNLDIQKGEFVALLGHNGSGKSTIAKMFNAMLLPAGGKVYVEGMDTLDESLVYEIRRRVGWSCKIRTTNWWPVSWKRTWHSARKTSASRRRRSAGGWTTR